MNGLLPSKPIPAEVVLSVITVLALLGAVVTGLCAVGASFSVRDRQDVVEIAQIIGKDAADIQGDSDRARRERKRHRLLLLVTAALAGIAALTDFMFPLQAGNA